MLFLPYLGPTQTAVINDPSKMTPAYDKNPGVITKCCIPWISLTEDCSGAFMAITTDPTMHEKHPTLPTKLSLSLRNIADKIVVITTDNAPNGVTRMASTKAYATKLQISPMIIRVIPVHHQTFFRYPYPSPASSLYLTFALRRPIFFRTKETPMNTPEATASEIPIAL